MSIIISQNGKHARKIDQSNFDKEDRLQQYIHENPESIPIYELNEDKRLFVVQREFPTNSGPIDALAIDQDGDIYIVETKLFKNPDKRTVVAQALDYGAALWKHSGSFSSFLEILNNTCQLTFSMSLEKKVMDFFKFNEDQATLLFDNMEHNLDKGNLKFVILMDSLDERLKDLIVYVNQNSQFDIYAVQIEYYKFEDYEIMIPKLYGGEVKKNIGSGSISNRQVRGENGTIEYFKQNLDQDELKIFLQIHEFCKLHGAKINYGTGNYASFSPVFRNIDGRSLFTISADKERRMSINFEWISDDAAQKIHKELSKIGFSFPKDYLNIKPSILFNDWKDIVNEFLEVIDSVLKSVK